MSLYCQRGDLWEKDRWPPPRPPSLPTVPSAVYGQAYKEGGGTRTAREAARHVVSGDVRAAAGFVPRDHGGDDRGTRQRGPGRHPERDHEVTEVTAGSCLAATPRG